MAYYLQSFIANASGYVFKEFAQSKDNAASSFECDEQQMLIIFFYLKFFFLFFWYYFGHFFFNIGQTLKKNIKLSTECLPTVLPVINTYALFFLCSIFFLISRHFLLWTHMPCFVFYVSKFFSISRHWRWEVWLKKIFYWLYENRKTTK